MQVVNRLIFETGNSRSMQDKRANMARQSQFDGLVPSQMLNPEHSWATN